MTPLMIQSYTGQFEEVKELIAKGAKTSLKALNGKTCLHYAAHSDSTELVEFLIENGARVNEKDSKGTDVLLEAMKAQNAEIVRILLDNGAKTYNRIEGRTYLTIAVLLKNPKIVEMMLEKKVDPATKDFKGKTAIDYARKNGFEEGLILIQEAMNS
jgi:uncharacterized protein